MEKKELTPRQKQAAALIGAGMTQADVARKLNIHQSTLCLWKKQEDFREAIDAEVQGVLCEVKGTALAVLTEQLSHKDPYVRQNAAKDLLTAYP